MGRFHFVYSGAFFRIVVAASFQLCSFLFVLTFQLAFIFITSGGLHSYHCHFSSAYLVAIFRIMLVFILVKAYIPLGLLIFIHIITSFHRYHCLHTSTSTSSPAYIHVFTRVVFIHNSLGFSFPCRVSLLALGFFHKIKGGHANLLFAH
jgi:hypothetical protein